MQEWKYEIIRLHGSKDRDMVPLLDAKGKSGWQLVSVVASPLPAEGKTEYLAFFKKPVDG
jgi:hypothetical protein